MLSRRIASAPAASASETCASVSHSTSIGRSVAARSRSTAARIEPAAREWLSFTSTPSSSPNRWFAPPPQRPRTSRAAAGPASSCACRGSRPGSGHGVDVPPRERRDPESRPRKFSAMRSPVRIARSGPATTGDHGQAPTGARLLDQGLEANVGIERPEHRLGRGEPATTPASMTRSSARADGVLLDRRLGRDVALAHVLGERGARRRAPGCRPVYSHVSRPAARRRTQERRDAPATDPPRGSPRGNASRGSPRDERALGDESREEVRRSRSRSSPASRGSARSRARAPSRRFLAPVRRGRPGQTLDGLVVGAGDTSGSGGLVERGERGPPTEDETLEQ